ncbi:bacteriocin-protection protein [Flavobacterium album]|uniref:Bacteriocin-protection protein n=1 Tax=Flavobacterium album TaxID=2175091 RepID=A0A2S1QYN9_9FLAO|nr:YdeI/OmpD-associated family protein [Flavobacterium album]AWH85361.1 bacteriocin-protection protein [Flavobacterium album]
MEPHFFKTQADFRKWLDKNSEKETELLVGFYKTNSGKPSMTWPESVDQALCFGWIDGVRKSLGEESYTIRFTPRKPTSIWSAVNIKKMEDLQKKGLVKPAGMAAFEKRKEHKSKIYSYEQEEHAGLPEAMEKEFRANKQAWDFFMDQAAWYRKQMLYRITSAKQEKTQQSRFEKLLNASIEGKRIP